MKKVYLAGPGIFRPDAAEYGAMLKDLCEHYGLKGLFPLDNEARGNNPRELAATIRGANIRMLEQSDYVVADLSPFRGPEPDSGTVWEVGYATALGKAVLGYSSDRRSQRRKTLDILGLDHRATMDRDGLKIEDFTLTHNLMFADIVRHGDLEACLADILERESKRLRP